MLRKLNRVWKIVKEVNLEAIRRRAETPFRLAVVAERPADRDAIVAMLLGASPAPSPFLQVAAPDEMAGEPAELAMLVSRTRDLPASLESARAALVSRRVPIVTVLVGSFGYLDTFARHGERKRVVLEWLPNRAAAPENRETTGGTLAAALFDAVHPDTRIALAREFPGLRQPLFEQLIEETSRANASYAFSTGLAEVVPLLDVPLNMGDIVVLTKNQLVMAYRIALASGKQGRPGDVVGEIAGVLGGSLLFRQIARELIGLIPVIGIVPKVAVAYGGTWAIGHAAVAWATGAEQATKRSVKELYSKGLERGRAAAQQLRSATA